MFEPQPDYRRFVDAMWRREPDRVPIAEIGIDLPMKEKLLGKPVRDVKTDVEFWWRAGYDYIYLRPDYEFPHTIPETTNTGRPQYGESDDRSRRAIASAAPASSRSWRIWTRYPWPDPDE